MYIPTTFFSSQGACISASVSSITGSGLITSGTFQSGSVLYQYYQFEMSDNTNPALTAFTASLNILSGSTGQAKILIVGGGGTGGNGNSGFVLSQNGPTYTTLAAGGGGAGGVVYYNQFPLSSGSYEIGIGNAIDGQSVALGTWSGAVVGKIGKPSYIKLPNNIIYTPFTSSFLKAYGGGGGSVQGGYRRFSPSDYFYSNQPTQVTESFASGGGAGGHTSFTGAPARVSPGNGNFTIAGGIDLGGLNGADQGNNGGQWCGGGGVGSGYDIVAGGPGGGGALTSGSNVGSGCAPLPTYISNGGDGRTFNLTGTPITVSNGGGGVTTSPSNTQGVRGSSAISTYGSGGNATRGAATPTQGNGGLVIITWPICLSDSDNCREYVISGGAVGGTMTYIPCDTQTATTTTIDFAYTGSACLYKVAGYPTTTGTVTLTEVGECNTFIPIQANVTCPTGSVKTPTNVFNWTIPGICYPTPSSCQRLYYPQKTLNYVDINAVSQSIQVGGGFTGNGQICARSQPTPTISGGTVTNTGLICGFYCSGSI